MRKRSTFDVREFFKLALRAGTLTYACVMAVVLIEGFAVGHVAVSWPVALLAYPLSVALFIVGPGLMWLFFRLLILISSASLRRSP
jgi:hypothetical protein